MAERGLNKVMLIGRLGADPEVRYTASERAVANLRLATSERWKDREGEMQERTEWHRVVMFGKLAEIAKEYLRKGDQIYAEGRLQTRKWQDQQGNDRYTTEIVANEMTMLGGRRDRDEGGERMPPAGNAPPGDAAPGPRKGRAPQAADSGDEFEDDIPF